MEKAFRHCDRDTLKMAVLKHEETFRRQVSSITFDLFFEKLNNLRSTDQLADLGKDRPLH
jgi:hypothetical protein